MHDARPCGEPVRSAVRVTRAAAGAAPARRSNTASRRPRASSAGPPIVAGVRISHPERVVFPEIGFTKLDLARFYERIAR